MEIGFDLDGTVLEQSIGLLRMMNIFGVGRDEELLKYYCTGLKMQLNPLDFIGEGDNLYFITGRNNCTTELTQKWAKKYFPMAKVFVLNMEAKAIDNFNEVQAELKQKILNDNKIDIYFEDNPKVVAMLRKLCPNTKIIHYGSRVSL